MPHMIPAYEFRRRARMAMKPVMSILVVALLIAMLPSLISNTITTMAGSDPSAALTEMYTEERITAMMGTDAAAATTATNEIIGGMMSFFQAKWPYMALTMALTMLCGPVLTLGLDHTLLKALRREEIGVTTVLARLPLFFKAVGLSLMTMLRLIGWMLPGWLLSLGAAVALVFEPTVGLLLLIAGMILMLVMMIRAMYSYRLSTYVMADDPTVGINAAIRRSKEVMKGRRMELFSLELSFMGWRLLIYLAQSMLLGLMGTVLGMTLGMFVSFLLQMYIYMAQAAFYQEYAVGPLPADAQVEENSDDLN